MRRRIVALYLVLVVIVSSFVAYITYRYSSEMYIREIESGLQHEAILITHIVNDKKQNNITDDFLKELSEILTVQPQDNEQLKAARRITLIDKNGRVLADSVRSSQEMENHSDRIEVINALKEGTGAVIRKSETTGLNLIYFAYYSKELDAIVRISDSVEHINDIRDTILFYAVIAVLVAMGISSLIALKLSGYAVRPIAKLVSEYGGSLEMNKKYSRRNDEVGQLSFALNSMTRNIEDIIKELKDRNSRVDNIINSMNDGLIAVDRSMHILMINPIADKLFGVTEKPGMIGVPLVQFIRNRQLNELLLKAITFNIVINDEIHIYQGRKRVLAVHVSPIYPMDNRTANTGALAFINDITQVRKLEEMRSQFVSNVTHELKTPLTSIQGFVETLKTGAMNDPAVAGKFLDIIDIEADRLRILINDILELSEIENMKLDKEKQLFALLPLAQEVGSMLENTASEKGVGLSIQINPDLKVEANQHRIKQLLINLMDNGIKYNKPGGTVTVSAAPEGNQIEIHVKDTGIGIPIDYTDRIFERFYRVDNGRSREMGGTGLGLSIVKHISQLYGGQVRVESEEGKGSDFIVTLPLTRDSNILPERHIDQNTI